MASSINSSLSVPQSQSNSPPPSSPLYNTTTSASSSMGSVHLPHTLSASDLAGGTRSYASSQTSQPSSPTDETDRGRPFSRSESSSVASGRATSAGPLGGAPLSATTSLPPSSGLIKTDSYENRKIRFAPLPEITGRDGEWVVDDQFGAAGSAGGDGSELSRTQSADAALQHEMSDDDDDDARDDDRWGRGGNGGAAGIFGSWRSDVSSSFGGRKHGDADERDSSGGLSSSYTAKLLRPLGFSSKKKSSSSSKRSSSSTRAGSTHSADSLSRQSSNDSDMSRGSSMDASGHGGGYKSTGIPMRKTRTWESTGTNNTASDSPREARRSNYPPVAQRSRRRPVAPVSISAPEFNEWGSTGSLGSVAAARKPGGADAEDEDDGSGLAWLKKRKAQREAEAAKKAEEEKAAAAAAAAAAQREATEQAEGETQVDDRDGDAEVPFELDDDEDEDEQQDAGSTANMSFTGLSATSTPPTSMTPRQQPPQSRLSMSRPALNVVSATPDGSPALVSQARAFELAPPSARTVNAESPVSVGTPKEGGSAAGGDDAHAQRLSDRLDQLNIGAAGTGEVRPASPEQITDDEDDEEDEEDDEAGRERDEDDDDDDLDEAELAQEEALAEQARMTQKAGGETSLAMFACACADG